MAAYMKNVCPFLGIPKSKRAEICKPFLKEAKKHKEIDWTFVDSCYTEQEREFHYLALEYIQAVSSLLTAGDILHLKRLVITKSWWDTVDCLDTIIGNVALKYPAVNEILLAWSTDDNIWLRRIAIDHQLQRKDKTDAELLEKIIVNNLGQKEFFVNKAIGWSLREYSKTDPEWVRGFIKRYKDKMAPLSIREASKYL